MPQLVQPDEELLARYVDLLVASQTLGIHPQSVRRLIDRGELPAIKISNKWIIRREILEHFAERYKGRTGRNPVSQQGALQSSP
jgi:excisionase family DNA binding protein